MNRYILILLILLICLIFIYRDIFLNKTVDVPGKTISINSGAYEHQLLVGNATFSVDIANDDATRSKGLGEREPMLANQGMFFLFNSYDRYPFWMKGMKFPIDIIWINNNTIMGVEKNVAVSTNLIPKFYAPKQKINKVLEIMAGEFDNQKLKIGDTIQLQ